MNTGFTAFCFSIISPVLISLYGEQLLVWVISAFLILNNLALKTNKVVVKHFSICSLYRIGVLVVLLFIICYVLYFVSPFIMIVFQSCLTVLEIIIFSAYSIKLDEYLATNYPNTFKDFSIARNSLKTDGFLVGLGISTVLSLLFGDKIIILFTLFCLMVYLLWLLYNFNFYLKRI